MWQQGAPLIYLAFWVSHRWRVVAVGIVAVATVVPFAIAFIQSIVRPTTMPAGYTQVRFGPEDLEAAEQILGRPGGILSEALSSDRMLVGVFHTYVGVAGAYSITYNLEVEEVVAAGTEWDIYRRQALVSEHSEALLRLALLVKPRIPVADRSINARDHLIAHLRHAWLYQRSTSLEVAFFGGLLLAAACVVGRRSRFQRIEEGLCPECGYSLSGLGSQGQCPECGAAFTRESD